MLPRTQFKKLSCTVNPSINLNYFPNTNYLYEWYWTDTELRVSFGDVNFYTDENCFRAVRGQTYGIPFFVDNGNGTVTDLSSGLMWQKATNSPDTFENALDFCENSTLGGFDDWRLPNVNELFSLADKSYYHPAIDTLYFPDTKTDCDGESCMTALYWTSTTDVSNVILNWTIDFNYGSIVNPYSSSYKEELLYFRVVRSAY